MSFTRLGVAHLSRLAGSICLRPGGRRTYPLSLGQVFKISISYLAPSIPGSNTVSFRQRLCRITAIFREAATAAFLCPLRSANFVAHSFNRDRFRVQLNNVDAAEYNNRRISQSPHLDILPDQSTSPD